MNHRALGIHAALALRRMGWVKGAAVCLCAASLAGWLWAVPHWQQQIEARAARLAGAKALAQAAQAEPLSIPRAVDQDRLANFHDLLGEQGYAEQQLKTLFAMAARSGLRLNQAEYKSGFDKSGSFATYQAVLPVNGTYAAIRQFCEAMLLAVPFASLDEVSFKRESIGSASLKARLRFTIYLRPAAPRPAESAPPTEAGERV